jgi:predicted DCC family thiol-disulfide oxidoreductase YuxK
MIETGGVIHSGAEAVYRTLSYTKKWKYLMVWYPQFPFFRALSDKGYRWVSANRPLLYKLSVLYFGNDPAHLRFYWIYHLLGVLLFLLVIVYSMKG